MTQQEATSILNMLKEGKRFSTRFQEVEWSIHHEKADLFIKTVYKFMHPKAEINNLNEVEVLHLFLKQNFEQTLTCMK